MKLNRSEFRRFLVGVGLGVLVVAALACSFSKTTVVDQVVGPNTGPSPTPVATPVPPDCQIASVVVTVDSGAVIPVNSQQRLDATPKGHDGGNLPGDCALPTITWSDPVGSASCRLGGATTSYNPFIGCTAPGTTNVSANVGGTVGTATFAVK